MFEPFYRPRQGAGAGSGLGLAIARGFLEANGGRIRAESLPGQGTSFVIQLPGAGDAAATGGRERSRVLVVRRRAPDPPRAADHPARRRLRGRRPRRPLHEALDAAGDPSAGRGDPRSDPPRRQRGGHLPLDPRVERDADHRALGGGRGGREGAGARGGRRRLRDEAVRPRRADRAPEGGAAPGQAGRARRAGAARRRARARPGRAPRDGATARRSTSHRPSTSCCAC